MANRSEREMSELKFRWEQRMYNPEFNELSYPKQALEIGVGVATIGRWVSEASPAFWKNVAETIRNQYARFAPEIDIALIEQAKGGSLGHQQLYYQRFEGWSPKQTNENINKNADLDGMTLEEKKAEALKVFSLEELEKAIAAKKAPSVVVDPKESNG